MELPLVKKRKNEGEMIKRGENCIKTSPVPNSTTMNEGEGGQGETIEIYNMGLENLKKNLYKVLPTRPPLSAPPRSGPSPSTWTS